MSLGIFSSIDPNTIVFGLLFVIFFVIIQLALSKTLKDKSSASIVALCVSLLAVYGISKTGFDVSGFFNNIGINNDIIYNIIPFIILAGLIFLFWKVKLRILMVFLGLGLIIASFFVYSGSKDYFMIGGIVILIFGIILMIAESRRRVKKRYYVGQT